MPACLKRPLLVIAALLVALSAAPALAAPGGQNPNGRFLGIVKHRGTQATPGNTSAPQNVFNSAPSVPGIGGSGNLEYHNGAVMHSNITHVIFWQPSGFLFGTSTATSDSYKALIAQYFTDVAADSGTHLNVYASDAQYTDGSGSASYDSTYAGAIVATDPFPTSGGCSPPRTSPCITDAQMQTEILHVIATNPGLSKGRGDMYFLYFPKGVANCQSSSGNSCSTNVYCAYHSYISPGTANEVIYANQPYPVNGCDNGQHPNGDIADEVISVSSHEHNESITDPDDVTSGNQDLSGWWDSSSGNENGDNCNFTFGPALGTAPNGQSYNQVINGHNYYLQLEWSNAHSACVGRYPDPTAAMSVTPSSPAAGQSATFDGTGSKDPGSTISSYSWDFGDSSSGTGSSTSHAYATAGTYTAKLTITDTDGVTATASKSVVVTPVNHPPACSAATASLYAGTSVPVTLSCSDPDTGDTITRSIVSSPAHGSLGSINQSTGSVTYTPNAGYSGSDSFTFKATDNHGLASSTATATITVNPNAVPACTGTSPVVPKGSSGFTVTLSCSDADSGDTISRSIVSGPSHGSLGAIDDTAGTVTYTPTAGYAGPDSFTFKATDNHGAASASATASITVDTPPTCSNGSATVTPGTATGLSLACSDADTGDTITRSIESPPGHGLLGSINQSTGAVTYTPDGGYVGPDSFTFSAKDSRGLSSVTRTETIAVDTPPSCTNTSVVVPAGPSAVAIPVTCTDPDPGDPITRSRVSGPAHGSLDTFDNAAGTVPYTPSPGYVGPDSFTFKATDSQNVASPPATASITVDTPPTCSDGSVTVPPGGSISVLLACSDPDTGDMITRSIVSEPTNGTRGSIDQITGRVTYTSTLAAPGTDSFTFKATDSHTLFSTTKKESITVDTAPVCSNASVSVAQGASVAVPLACVDADAAAGDSVPTNSIAAAAAHGSAVVDDTTHTALYTPTPGYSGPDQFTFTGTDTHGVASSPATASITVEGPSNGSGSGGGGGGGGGGGSNPGTPPVTTPPLTPFVPPGNVFSALVVPHVTGLRASPGSFNARRGATVRWTLDLAAGTSFQVWRVLPGVSAGGRCFKPSGAVPRARRCTRLASQGRPVTHAGSPGGNSFRLKTSALAAGSYRITAVATDAAGNTGPSATTSFRIR